MTVVTTAAGLLDALATADDIEVDGTLSGMPAITLRPGTSLRGGTLRFGARGIRLTSDNRLEDVTVLVPDTEVAIGTSSADVGRLALLGLGIEDAAAAHSVALFREHDEKTLTASHAIYRDEVQLIQTTRDAAQELESLFEADRAGS